MDITSILVPERTVSGLAASSKKRAIELASEHIVSTLPHLDIGTVYRALIEREKLGTTAIGEGVAIPHCRIRNSESIIGGLFVLNEAVDFAAYDDEPVSILFFLLVPEDEESEHLKTLAMLAERFSSKDYRASLLAARDSEALFEAAISPLPSADSAAGQQ